MLMRWTPIVLACLLTVAGPASAGEGEVCLAAEQTTPAGVMTPFDDSTIFQCRSTGKVTISQLYTKGWKVVSVFPQSTMSPAKPGMVSVLWTLVVEKD